MPISTVVGCLAHSTFTRFYMGILDAYFAITVSGWFEVYALPSAKHASIFVNLFVTFNIYRGRV